MVGLPIDLVSLSMVRTSCGSPNLVSLQKDQKLRPKVQRNSTRGLKKTHFSPAESFGVSQIGKEWFLTCLKETLGRFSYPSLPVLVWTIKINRFVYVSIEEGTMLRCFPWFLICSFLFRGVREVLRLPWNSYQVLANNDPWKNCHGGNSSKKESTKGILPLQTMAR